MKFKVEDNVFYYILWAEFSMLYIYIYIYIDVLGLMLIEIKLI
jgi:hypothetical protein